MDTKLHDDPIDQSNVGKHSLFQASMYSLLQMYKVYTLVGLVMEIWFEKIIFR